MKTCVILGGCGYVGYRWAARLLNRRRFDRVILADIRPPAQPLNPGLEFVECDVRHPLRLGSLQPEWLFNFAAVHREPGHARKEVL